MSIPVFCRLKNAINYKSHLFLVYPNAAVLAILNDAMLVFTFYSFYFCPSPLLFLYVSHLISTLLLPLYSLKYCWLIKNIERLDNFHKQLSKTHKKLNKQINKILVTVNTIELDINTHPWSPLAQAKKMSKLQNS